MYGISLKCLWLYIVRCDAMCVCVLCAHSRCVCVCITFELIPNWSRKLFITEQNTYLLTHSLIHYLSISGSGYLQATKMHTHQINSLYSPNIVIENFVFSIFLFNGSTAKTKGLRKKEEKKKIATAAIQFKSHVLLAYFTFSSLISQMNKSVSQ